MDRNCYRLRPDGVIVPGVPRVTGDTHRLLVLQHRECRVELPHRETSRGFPRSSGGMLMEGAPLTGSKNHKALTGRNGWGGSLLFIETFNLAFSKSVSSHFGLDNIWPGAEVMEYPFVQIGSRHDADQLQLLALEDGEIAYVADRSAGYARVQCRAGQVFVRRPDKVLFAEMLIKRARAKCFTHQSLTWTYHSLQRMGLCALWPQDLELRLRNVQRASSSKRSVSVSV